MLFLIGKNTWFWEKMWLFSIGNGAESPGEGQKIPCTLIVAKYLFELSFQGYRLNILEKLADLNLHCFVKTTHFYSIFKEILV